jgi:hypothetical protein
MKRKKIMGLAVGAVVALFCAWSVWRLVSELSDAAAAERQRDAARGQLEGIFQLKPFPSDTNRLQVAADRERMTRWLGEMSNLMVETNASAALSPSLFMQNLQRDMRELATLPSVTGAKLVPDGFAFGFDRYLGAEGRMPEPEDVPQLSRQLKMVDRLCRELAAAGIIGLTAIRREEFEAGTVKPVEPAPETGGRGRRGAKRPAVDKAGPKSLAAAAAQRASRHHFVVEFSARKNATFDTLNRLAAMELFVTVTEVAIRKTADDLKEAPAAPTEADKGKGKTEIPDAIQRVVAGPLVDPPLSVRIELDVHVFEGV